MVATKAALTKEKARIGAPCLRGLEVKAAEEDRLMLTRT